MPNKEPAPDQLEPGETVLALAVCSPPGAIEKQAAQPIRIVVTDRRFLASKTSRMTGRTKGEIELEVPLRAMSYPFRPQNATQSRRSESQSFPSGWFYRMGPHWCSSGTSGFRIKGLRHFADVLQKTAQTVPESKYGSSVEASDAEEVFRSQTPDLGVAKRHHGATQLGDPSHRVENDHDRGRPAPRCHPRIGVACATPIRSVGPP